VAQLKEFYSDDPPVERVLRRKRPRAKHLGLLALFAFFGSVGAGRYRDLRFVAKKKHDSLKKERKKERKKEKKKKERKKRTKEAEKEGPQEKKEKEKKEKEIKKNKKLNK
jgi:hypothetical protein